MGGQSIPLEGIWSIAQTLSQNCNFSLMPKWNFLYYLSLHCVCLVRSLTPSYLQGKIFLDSGRLQPNEYLGCSSFCLSSISLMRPQTAHSTSHVAPEAPKRIKQSIATSWWLSSCYYSWGCCCLCGSQRYSAGSSTSCWPHGIFFLLCRAAPQPVADLHWFLVLLCPRSWVCICLHWTEWDSSWSSPPACWGLST